MEINKCPRPYFDKLVEFMLQYGNRLWFDDRVIILEMGVPKQQYVVHQNDGIPIGYVFDNKLVVPEEVV